MGEEIFSEIIAKIASEYINRITARSGRQDLMFTCIGDRAGVSFINESNSWYIQGNWEGVNSAYNLLSTFDSYGEFDCSNSLDVHSIAPITPISLYQQNESGEAGTIRFAANTPNVPGLSEDNGDVFDLMDLPVDVADDASYGTRPSTEIPSVVDFGDRSLLLEEEVRMVDDCIVLSSNIKQKKRKPRALKKEKHETEDGSSGASLARCQSVVLDLSAKATLENDNTNNEKKNGRTNKPKKKKKTKDCNLNGLSSVVDGGTQNYANYNATGEVSVISSINQSNSENSSGKLPYQCNVCSKSFSTSSNLSRHVKTSHSNVRFQCRVCQKKFTCRASLQHHERVKHIEIRCKVCHESFATKSDEEAHVCSGSRPSTSSHPCGICQKIFTTSSNLYKHFRSSHTAVTCKECSKQFGNRTELGEHLLEQHGLSMCKFCARLFTSAATYAEHVAADHKGNKIHYGLKHRGSTLTCRQPHVCEICSKVFSNSSNLHKHKRIIHFNSRFSCTHCSAKYACKEQLTVHVQRKHQGVKFTCYVCHVKFENRLQMVKHLKLIHNKQDFDTFQCELCGKTFLYQTNLRRHRKQDHDGLRFACVQCGIPFRSKQQVVEHYQIVHLANPIACNICQKQFSSKLKLREHTTAVHTRLQPLKCAVCSQRFSRHSALSYHLRKRHGRKVNIAGVIMPEVETKKAREVVINISNEPDARESLEIISHDNTANTMNLETAEPSDSNATQDVGTAAFQNHADLIPVIVVMPNPSQNTNTINQDDLQSIAPVSSSDNAALPDNYQQLLDVQLQNLLALVGLHNQIGAALNSQSHTDVSGNFDSFVSPTSGIFSSPTVCIPSSDGSSGMMQTITSLPHQAPSYSNPDLAITFSEENTVQPSNILPNQLPFSNHLPSVQSTGLILNSSPCGLDLSASVSSLAKPNINSMPSLGFSDTFTLYDQLNDSLFQSSEQPLVNFQGYSTPQSQDTVQGQDLSSYFQPQSSKGFQFTTSPRFS